MRKKNVTSPGPVWDKLYNTTWISNAMLSHTHHQQSPGGRTTFSYPTTSTIGKLLKYLRDMERKKSFTVVNS